MSKPFAPLAQRIADRLGGTALVQVELIETELIEAAEFRLLQLIHTQLENIMSQLDDFNTKITALQQTATDTATRVGTAQTSLQAIIDDLKAHPAAPDLTAQLAALDGVAATLSAIDPAAPPADGSTPIA